MRPKKNKSFLRLFPFFFLLSSCAINSAPDNNVDFLPQAKLSNLSGTYSNYGEPNGFFSKDVLNLNEISHEQVKLVKLTAGKIQSERSSLEMTASAMKRPC